MIVLFQIVDEALEGISGTIVEAGEIVVEVLGLKANCVIVEIEFAILKAQTLVS